MTLPSMKIWTGGVVEYTERTQKALAEVGFHGYHDCPAQQFDYIVTSGHGDTSRGAGRNLFHAHDKPACRLAPNGNLVPAEADDDGWIAWHGGDCPVDGSTEVEAQLRNNAFILSEARELRWHPRDGMRIIGVARYRIPSMVFPTSQKLEQGTVMSETLTKAQALREVAQGYEEGDENPWGRIEATRTSTAWAPVVDGEEFNTCAKYGFAFRRKPRTVRIEGEISEEAVDGLRKLERTRVEIGGNSMSDVAAEILSTVQNQ